MRKIKRYLLGFPLLRLLAFGSPHKVRLAGLAAVIAVITCLLLSESLIVKYAIDEGLNATDKSGTARLNAVYLAAGLYVFVNVATWALSYIEAYGTGWVGQQMILDLRTALFGHLQSLSLRYFSEQKAGWIISRLTNDIENFNDLLNDGVQNLIRNGLTLVGVLFMIFFLDWRLALAMMTIVPVMAVATALFRVYSMRLYRRAREAIAEVAAFLQEHVSGMRVVQAFTREEIAGGQFDGHNLRYRRINARSSLLNSIYFPGVEFLSVIGLIIVLLYGGYLAIQGRTSIGTIAAFITLLNMVFQPIQQLSQLYSQLQNAMASLEKVFAILDSEPDRADHPKAKTLRHVEGDVEFDDVAFGYEADDPVLEDVSFRIRPGETLAIVGETGAGKSTIVKLLSRLYDPTGGTVRVDGQNLKDVRGSSLRRHMGVVLQDTFLFAGTVEENIRYGRPGASREDVISAARVVGADDFIRRFPEGYDTQVRERGSRLSVGERQLISFARALLAEPRILILDEATSSVDLATEARIERALGRLLAGRTSVVIAHRLSTVRRADRILVVGDGHVVEQGSHDELFSRPSAYRRLYESQFAA